jgi:hypothetical protein
LFPAPGPAQLFEIVPDEQRAAALAQVINFAGFEFPAAQATFQMRQGTRDCCTHLS